MSDKEIIIGRDIKAQQIRLVTEHGSELVELSDALQQAASENKDLIQVSMAENVPVCKILELSKYIYEVKKKEKQKTKKQPVLKELQVSIKIGDADLMTKVRQAIKFIKDGHKVKFFLRLRRWEAENETVFKNAAVLLQETILQLLNTQTKARIEKPASRDNRIISAIYSPAK